MLLRFLFFFMVLFFIPNLRNVECSPKRFHVYSLPLNCDTDVAGKCVKTIKRVENVNYKNLLLHPKTKVLTE